MSSKLFQFGAWSVDPARNLISQGEIERHLQPLSMDVLVYLLEHAEETIAAESLLAFVWSDRLVERNAVPRAINQIRCALGDDSRHPEFIETVRKRGYRTIARVVRREDDAASQPLAHGVLRGFEPDSARLNDRGAQEERLLAAGQYAGVLTVALARVARDPSDVGALLLQGQMQQILGRRHSARASFERALSLAPEDLATLRAVLEFYLVMRGARASDVDRAEAIIMASPAARTYGTGRELGLIAYRRGDPRSLRRDVEVRLEAPDGASPSPVQMMHDQFLLHAFEQHMSWCRIRIAQRTALAWLAFEQRGWEAYRRYWSVLEGWAMSVQAMASERERALAGHRALLRDTIGHWVP